MTAPAVEIVAPREVPLGGPRAMLVRRTLPSRQRSLIGAWCFLDHYGPDRVADSGGMSVAPHPHTGLQTVSWLFTGQIRHRDSAGNEALVRPGELNLMTAGHGISHSEVSTEQVDELHGAQLWVALPDAARDTAPRFDHYAPPAVSGPGWTARVFLGALAGEVSPVRTHTPLLGAEILIPGGGSVDFDLDPVFEHGVLVDRGSVQVDGEALASADLGYLAPGRTRLALRSEEGTRLLLLGGPPFGEEIVMWWNFVGRSHDEIVAFRRAWHAQIDAPADHPAAPDNGGPSSTPAAAVVDAAGVRAGRFGVVPHETLAPIPAPALPNARLRPRS